jgi:hypothetical protein
MGGIVYILCMNTTDQTPKGYTDKRAAMAKYHPAPKDTLATIQYLILRHQRGEVTWEISESQREMARKFFDYEF